MRKIVFWPTPIYIKKIIYKKAINEKLVEIIRSKISLSSSNGTTLVNSKRTKDDFFKTDLFEIEYLKKKLSKKYFSSLHNLDLKKS